MSADNPDNRVVYPDDFQNRLADLINKMSNLPLENPCKDIPVEISEHARRRYLERDASLWGEFVRQILIDGLTDDYEED